jgi:hypothetical protein
MNSTVTHRLEMFIDVREFKKPRADVFTSTSRGGELFTQLDEVISEIEGHAASQSSGKRASKEKTTLKSVALANLIEDLEAVSRTARVMALTIPGLDDKFRMPRNVGEQAWLAAARSFAADAEPLKAEFVRRGLPESFLEDLKADTAELQESIQHKSQTSGARVAARAAIDDAVERGMKIVRELDAIVRNIFRNDPATLAEWVSASHVERAPRRAAAPVPPVQRPTSEV